MCIRDRYYDLHIHSALSPCSDDTMTIHNIFNMAYIKGLDLIAITDHNSLKQQYYLEKVIQSPISVSYTHLRFEEDTYEKKSNKA